MFPSSELPTKKKINWREYKEELVRIGKRVMPIFNEFVKRYRNRTLMSD